MAIYAEYVVGNFPDPQQKVGELSVEKNPCPSSRGVHGAVGGMKSQPGPVPPVALFDENDLGVLRDTKNIMDRRVIG